MRNPDPLGFRVELGAGLDALLHPDGALSLEDGQGHALDFQPGQVEQLAALLALGAGLRARARRRRAQTSYERAQQVEY